MLLDFILFSKFWKCTSKSLSSHCHLLQLLWLLAGSGVHKIKQMFFHWTQ